MENKYKYYFKKYNSYEQLSDLVIVDESQMLHSPAYIHVFYREDSKKKYYIISDSTGIPMPSVLLNNDLIIGTSYFIYFINTHTNSVVRKEPLPSACIEILLLFDNLLIICENDILFLSLENNIVFNFEDVIIGYKIEGDYLKIKFMDDPPRKIAIPNNTGDGTMCSAEE